MQDIRQRIAGLESGIMATEEKIAQHIMAGHQEEAKRSMAHLESDLKYLSVLVNGAPIDRDEDRRLMDFLRIHYNRLKEYTQQVRHL